MLADLSLAIYLLLLFGDLICPFLGKKASQNSMRKKDEKLSSKTGYKKKGKGKEKKKREKIEIDSPQHLKVWSKVGFSLANKLNAIPNVKG